MATAVPAGDREGGGEPAPRGWPAWPQGTRAVSPARVEVRVSFLCPLGPRAMSMSPKSLPLCHLGLSPVGPTQGSGGRQGGDPVSCHRAPAFEPRKCAPPGADVRRGLHLTCRLGRGLGLRKRLHSPSPRWFNMWPGRPRPLPQVPPEMPPVSSIPPSPSGPNTDSVPQAVPGRLPALRPPVPRPAWGPGGREARGRSASRRPGGCAGGRGRRAGAACFPAATAEVTVLLFNCFVWILNKK